jgi:hypothetical protein
MELTIPKLIVNPSTLLFRKNVKFLGIDFNDAEFQLCAIPYPWSRSVGKMRPEAVGPSRSAITRQRRRPTRVLNPGQYIKY